jgi:nuclear pore complex protein Nup54
VPDQIQTLARKWDPTDPTTVFTTYLYNSVPKDERPFYAPSSRDDEEKWEAALRGAPNDSSIPVLVTGFSQLGRRIILQRDTLNTLHGRLHEINNGLTDLLRRHDLEISARAAECRRRHMRLSQKCLALATKTQVLRNRGYAMDVGEEQIKQKLIELEKKILDPALNGRSEEIWARMVTVRDRATALTAEVERLGQLAKSNGVNTDTSTLLDEETMKKVKKVQLTSIILYCFFSLSFFIFFYYTPPPPPKKKNLKLTL